MNEKNKIDLSGQINQMNGDIQQAIRSIYNAISDLDVVSGIGQDKCKQALNECISELSSIL